MDELAQTLTVAAKKLKAITLGFGWTKAPRSSSSTSRPSPPQAARPSWSAQPSSSAPRALKHAEDKRRRVVMLKQKHPCSIFGELGHWYNDKDDGKPQCRMYASGRLGGFTDATRALDPSGLPYGPSDRHKEAQARRHS